LSGNSAGQSGGAIYNGTGSGSVSLSLTCCTLSSNSAAFAGGILHNGVGGSAILYLANNIFRTGTSGANLSITLGNVVNYGYNLSSDNGGGVLTNGTDQINTNPLLGPLADNGGPTLTHALLPGSPAIDKGYSFGQSTDQRGEPRVFDFSSITNLIGPADGADIGAFEVGRPKLKLQKSGNDAVLSWLAYSSEFTLQSSTNAALSNSWVTAAGSAGVVIDHYQQTNGPVVNNRFFRLRHN
jgi:hypothetical protein